MTEKPRRLATYVRVAGRRWGPDDVVPDEVARRITNPKVWAVPGDEAVAGPSGQAQQAEQQRRGGTRGGVRLASYVRVGGRRYGPDDEVPDQVARRITNPKAWEGGALPAISQGDVVDSRAASDNPPTLPPSPQASAEQDARERMPAPPRSGRGSGIDAWQAFAVDHDVEVPDGASRDDIIAACVQANVIPAE